MSRLSQGIATWIAEHMRSAVASMQGPPELRAVFNGPPPPYLTHVFEDLTRDGELEARLPDGTTTSVPVMLQVDELPEGVQNPQIGTSGVCDAPYLLTIRNSPDCRIYIGLVPPAQHSSLSTVSTRYDLGLSPLANSGTATTAQWVGDQFVQDLIFKALGRHSWPSVGSRDDAHRLVEESLRAADDVGRHEPSRQKPWQVLSRLWSIERQDLPFGSYVSLACGYPPCEDGGTNEDEQARVLNDLAVHLEEAGFRAGIEQLKARSVDEDITTALGEFLDHLHRHAVTPTAFVRAPSYYYAPFSDDHVGQIPVWWTALTVESWTRLLDQDVVRRDSLGIQCTNSVATQTKGFVPVAKADAAIRITVPPGSESAVEVVVTRETGGASNRREWKLSVLDSADIVDDDVPSHKTPVRYSVYPANLADESRYKKGSVRVIVLEKWVPGFVVCGRTASKTSVPKAPRTPRDRVAYECLLTVTGLGRHYLDVFSRSSVKFGDEALGSDESATVDSSRKSVISRISESELGFEIEVTGETFYQFSIERPESDSSETVRVYISGEEVAAEKCGSEFERLIRLNDSQSRGSTDVEVDRQLRCADLQSWLLSKERIDQSFYPFVVAPDYSEDWRARDWTPSGVVLSKGHFLHDPRPDEGQMVPPLQFVSARREIAKRIRGEDENGLVEAARLGEWLASDTEFAELVESYVRSYGQWLEAFPESAAWSDVGLVTRFEADGRTLIHEPDAIIVSPLHPVRFAWHCMAQRALFLAQRKHPCPAASILDPDSVPDCVVLPLRTAAGAVRSQAFFSVECSSDYWSVLWSASKLDRLGEFAGSAPLDSGFGILVGGIASGFSVSQVHRALNDVETMLVAKPVISVIVSSAAGQNNACNAGIVSWAREQFGEGDGDGHDLGTLGARLFQVFDEREASSRPDDTEIANLSEDTGNAVRWYAGDSQHVKRDLGIIAQLQSSSPGHEPTKIASPVGVGGLLRSRIRQQLKGGNGAFLSESRMGQSGSLSGDGLANQTVAALVRLENLSLVRFGYTFAPSVHAVKDALEKAVFAAVSSSAVDPACFLGGWLEDAYLWDYDLPSYSTRSGDSTGYYLLSRIKQLDREALGGALGRLQGCGDCSEELVDQVLLEVAHRGIPTVRGLSGGDTSASGAVGVFVAARILQDEFRSAGTSDGLLSIWSDGDLVSEVALIVPVDPFRPYLDDLTRSLGRSSFQRPDLVAMTFEISESKVRCKVVPLEVKFRGARDLMTQQACVAALQQNRSFCGLLRELGNRSDDPDMLLWRLAYQHLLTSLVSFGFRVYSQHPEVVAQSGRWAEHHARVVQAILSGDLSVELDDAGRLIAIDGSVNSAVRDSDADGNSDSLILSHADAVSMVKGDAKPVHANVKQGVGDWRMRPSGATGFVAKPDDKPKAAQESPKGTSENIPPSPMPPTVVPKKPQPSTGPANPPDNGRNSSDEKHAGVQLFVGHLTDTLAQEKCFVQLSDTGLNQLNCGVVGDLGTGKTQLLKSLIYQIARSAPQNEGVKPRILIFDYKKDYRAEDFVAATGARVVKPTHLPFNLFDVSTLSDSPAPWLDRFKFFSDVLDKIYAGIGPVQRANLKRAIKSAYDECQLQHRAPNIYDVHQSYERIVGAKPDSVIAIIEDLVDMQMFASDASSIKSFDAFLDGVVVVDLAALGQDDRTKNMLVAIMLNMFYEHMLRIPKRPYVGDNPKRRVIDSFLLVDEADNIMRYDFDVLRKVLLQGREFGVGVILASQYLKHFKTSATDYREPLLTWFIHKVPNVSQVELSALGMTGEAPQLAGRIKELALHECLFKSFGQSGAIVRGTPFYQLRNEAER